MLQVIAKNHSTKKLARFNASAFYKLFENDTMYAKWEPGPVLTNEDKMAHFGIMEGSFMIIHTLLAMSGK